jgi:uncharacterized protein (TIGR02246 family)
MTNPATAGDPAPAPISRPTIGIDGPPAAEAEHAVELLIRDLQAGWDGHDADVTDRRLATDVLWGSPYGATVRGHTPLHDIHVRLKQQSVGGRSSRFELVQWLTPGPGIVVAQIRRTALDPAGHPVPPEGAAGGAFSEMALYVLAKRDGDWWVAAGQNTPITA